MNYDLMLIDDDRNVLERLSSIIHWSELPLRLVCQAADSETAKELYLLYRPKIIITDINIPIISGLELARELLREDDSLQFIVITGYNDFELARQSLELRAVRLLGKPVREDELNSGLQEAIDRLELAHRERTSRNALQELMNSSLPQLQSLYLSKLCSGKSLEPERIPEKLRQLRLPLSGPGYVTVLVTFASRVAEQELESMTLQLISAITGEMEQRGIRVCSYTDPHMRLTCILSVPFGSDEPVEEALAKVRDQLRFDLDAHICAGIGPTVTQPGELYLSFNGALAALNYQLLLGGETIVHYKNLERTEIPLLTQESIYSRVRRLFLAGDLPALEVTLRRHMSYLSGGAEDSHPRNFCFEYLSTIANEALRMGADSTAVEKCGELLLRLLQKDLRQPTPQELLSLTQQLLGAIQTKQERNSNHLIGVAKEYISKHLPDKQLDLGQVSSHVGLSRMYFCRLFHQVEEVTFNNYLKLARVDHAKHLLKTTSLKVFEISEACGFSNAKYFSYVFRQLTGQTPLDYRDGR